MLKKNKKLIATLLGLVVIAGSVAIAAEVSDVYVSGKWRYRVTVEVETPEGISIGSAVHEVSNSDSSIKILDFPEAGNPAEFKGEAVVVDLGKRGVVFALVPTTHIFYSAFWGSGGGVTTIKGIEHFNKIKAGTTKTVDPKDYPQFVTFKDINEPRSVMLVRGWEFDVSRQQHIPVDNFAKTFGEGVSLRSITLEITDEPVTWGVVDKYLPASFWEKFQDWWNSLDIRERSRKSGLFQFKQGEWK